MTPLKNEYDALGIEKKLLELVKLELAMKKHFVYIDDIDELRHNKTVIRDFDRAISDIDGMIAGLKKFRNRLNNSR